MLSGHSWRVAVQRSASLLDLEWKIHFLTQFEKKSCIGKAPTKQSLLDAGGKPNQTTTKKKIKTNMIHEMAGMGNDLLTHKSHKGGGWFYPIQSFGRVGSFLLHWKLTNRVCACAAEITSLQEQPSHWHMQSRKEGKDKSLRLYASKTIHHSTIETHQISFIFIILK